MVLFLGCQKLLLFPVLWTVSWQDGADLLCYSAALVFYLNKLGIRDL